MNTELLNTLINGFSAVRAARTEPSSQAATTFGSLVGGLAAAPLFATVIKSSSDDCANAPTLEDRDLCLQEQGYQPLLYALAIETFGILVGGALAYQTQQHLCLPSPQVEAV